MARRLNKGLVAVVTALFLVSLHALFNTIYVESTSEGKNKVIGRTQTLGDFIDISGSAASFPLQCKTCALVGTSGIFHV
ncbi:hypothetical protein TNCV_1361461 [Trichonephila clavipes]|nr:hypothetical protein TNCV_1361461 [Trichonephila clavipes]